MALVGKILIVEDESRVRFFLEQILSSDGHSVQTVGSAEEGLGLVENGQFDLMLVDLQLPGMDGIDLLKKVRQIDPLIVVIVLTAHASLETSVEALRQGAHDYLFKPSKTADLRASVERGLLKRQEEEQQNKLLSQVESLASTLSQLRGPSNQKTTPTPQMESPSKPASTESESRFLQRGSLIVDYLRHIATLEGHLLELSPTEFSLLAYLVGEAPRVLSHKELIREVQGYDTEEWEASDIVRQHVHRIRRKIKAATGRNDVIRTVRGIGYTIAAEV